MRVLLTGASSFTGYWFARTLARQGHSVTATLQRRIQDYDSLRAQRLSAMLEDGVIFVEQATFGNENFLELFDIGHDILCHHAADVTNYRSPEFDIVDAVAANTRNIRFVMQRAIDAGTKAVILTGSVFEPNEGIGEPPLRAFSSYGLSKSLTWQIMAHQAQMLGLSIGKFVIPNPFGIFEEPRFCAYLMRTWAGGEIAEVKTPDYVRDNIPVDKLAFAYSGYVADHYAGRASERLAPTGYVESQGSFAIRFAREIGTRLNLATPLELAKQSSFEEPLMRVNSDRVCPDWDELAFWDSLAQYYDKTYPRMLKA